MGIPEYLIGPGDPIPPDIEEADLFAATIVDEAVLILLPRFSVTQINRDGTLLAADAFETAIRGAGGTPLRDVAFDRAPAPGWLVSISTATAEARISGPGVLGEVYHGSLPPVDAPWLSRVVESRTRGIVLITGSADSTPDAALDMIAEGRASWVRSPVELIGPAPTTETIPHR